LDIPLSELYQQADLTKKEIEEIEANKDVVHIRKDKRKSLEVKGSRASIQPLTPTTVDHKLELLWQEVDAKSSGGDYLTHEGEECCFVVKGEIRMYIEDQVYQLKEGDSLWFRTAQRHKWDNPSDKPAVIIWAITPPYHGAI
ncbi:MAG: cupin domain-containing protein, partial [Spirochaetia bacterium]